MDVNFNHINDLKSLRMELALILHEEARNDRIYDILDAGLAQAYGLGYQEAKSHGDYWNFERKEIKIPNGSDIMGYHFNIPVPLWDYIWMILGDLERMRLKIDPNPG